MIAPDAANRVWTTANTSVFGSASGRPTQRPAIKNPITGVFAYGTLEIVVEWDADQYVAVEGLTNMFGEGDSPPEALEDLVLSLRELRDALAIDDGRLAPDLQEQLEVLRASPL